MRYSNMFIWILLTITADFVMCGNSNFIHKNKGYVKKIFFQIFSAYIYIYIIYIIIYYIYYNYILLYIIYIITKTCSKNI